MIRPWRKAHNTKLSIYLLNHSIGLYDLWTREVVQTNRASLSVNIMSNLIIVNSKVSAKSILNISLCIVFKTISVWLVVVRHCCTCWHENHTNSFASDLCSLTNLLCRLTSVRSRDKFHRSYYIACDAYTSASCLIFVHVERCSHIH